MEGVVVEKGDGGVKRVGGRKEGEKTEREEKRRWEEGGRNKKGDRERMRVEMKINEVKS